MCREVMVVGLLLFTILISAAFSNEVNITNHLQFLLDLLRTDGNLFKMEEEEEQMLDPRSSS